MQNKSCTIGKRHKWNYSGSTTFKRKIGEYVPYTMRGVYLCDCGARKLGDYRPELGRSK